MFDLLLTNGKAVLKEGIREVAVGITGEKIAGVFSHHLDLKAEKKMDLGGNFILPGVIDPHTHFGIYNDWQADFRTESAMAAQGGVTTVINFHRSADDYLDLLPQLISSAEQETLIDFKLHLGIITEKQIQLIPEYFQKWGISSYKFYANYKGVVQSKFGADDGLNLDHGDLWAIMVKLKETSPETVLCVHCENMDIRHYCSSHLKEVEDSLEYLTKKTPDFVETDFMLSSLYLAQKLGVRIYAVHISSGESIKMLREVPYLRRGGVIETCPHYLVENVASGAGLLPKIDPPVRFKSDNEEIWKGIEEGIVDTIGTDHCANLLAKKQGTGIEDTLLAFSSSGLQLPILLDEGYHQRGISLNRIADLLSVNTAKAFGLYPQKGSLLPGTDADLVVVDLEKEREISTDYLEGSSDYSIYQGRKVKGWPVLTVLRGNIIAEDGEITAESKYGRYLGQ